MRSMLPVTAVLLDLDISAMIWLLMLLVARDAPAAPVTATDIAPAKALIVDLSVALRARLPCACTLELPM